MVTDSELLQRYRESRCEAAFTELVRRYLNFVYSAARRQVGGNAHLAQDLSQAVFVELARKAPSLPSETVLTGWLYTRVRYAAAKAVRAEQRRHIREEKASMEISLHGADLEPGWQELQPVLDTVMHELNERDRNAVLLRYFEDRPLAEVGAQLGLTEDAARMRVGRALEKLRSLLARRGVTSTAAALAVLLPQQTIIAAPAGLVLDIAGAALASATTATTTLTLTTFMAATKLKIALVSVAALAIATPVALQHRSTLRLREEIKSLREQNDRLAALSSDNARLSKLLAEAETRTVVSADPPVELLKLRAEVARLREDSRQLARVQAASAGNGHDPSIQATLQTLAERATALKRHLEQRPHTKIPELKLVDDKELIDAVAKGALGTDQEIREALSRLRSSAKGKFGSMMQKALKQYTEAHGGMLPNDLSQLQPYFNPPIDPAMLQRYQLVQSGSLAESLPDKPLISEIAPAVDDEYDTRFDFRVRSVSSRPVSRAGEAMRSAVMAYADANNGLLPREPGQISPYLQESVAPDRVQKFLGDIPSNVRTIDEWKRR